jgi:uncharacterized protein YbjT (DUF2867 family)
MFATLPGIAHTVVNPGFFADSPYMEMMPFAAHLGVFPLPVAGKSRNAPPSVDDIARVAVAALLDPARHAGKSYRPTGPKLLSVVEMTAVIGQVVGHKVRRVRTSLWMFYCGLDWLTLRSLPASTNFTGFSLFPTFFTCIRYDIVPVIQRLRYDAVPRQKLLYPS